MTRPPSAARPPGAHVVVGAGGHAKVVIAAMRAMGLRVDAVLDDSRDRWGETFHGAPILGGIGELAGWPGVRAVITVGNNARRRAIAEAHPGVDWLTVVHPAAIVHESATLGPGAMVMWRAVVEPDVVIGAHAIVNTGAAVCHDARVGDYAHVSVTSTLAGGAVVGHGVFLGMNACVIGTARVGDWATVGAGASVVRDVPAGATAVGVPARVISAKASAG
jgi:sugar O-acyltransferase (sialic acid O-acetyltransferase NeuD family)